MNEEQKAQISVDNTDPLAPQSDHKPKKKRRVLWLSDYACATGFAQVAHNLLLELHKTGLYEFDVIGINYPGGYVDKTRFPIPDHDFRLYPAWPQGRQDMFGRDLLISALANRNMEIRGPWDLVFTLNDHFILEPMATNIASLREDSHKKMPPEYWFKWIGYWPVDAPTKENWVTRSIAQSDYPVAYCQYGYEQIMTWDQPGDIYEWYQQPNEEKKIKGSLLAPSLKGRTSIIRHGTNTKDFYPLPPQERERLREELFAGKLKKDDFLIVNVSRNQPRKDIARTFKIFAEFQKKVPNAFLYVHARLDDVGGNLYEMARHFNIDHGRWAYPKGFNEGKGFPISFVNNVYNIADVCISTTLGEGWGLMATEAMACKTPMVGPNHTSFTEILNAPQGFDPNTARGIPIEAGSTSSEFICLGQTDNERIRPLTNVDDAVSKLFWVYKNPDKVKEIVERAYSWATELTWENECKKWVELFDMAYQQLENERNQTNSDLGRNDPCWCGSSRKFKNCHGK